MGEFLTTAGVSHRLEQIIKNANEDLILISPYFNVNRRVKELLEHKDRENINIRVVCRKSKLPKSENNWFSSLASVHTVFRKNLHAKCYLNENEALLTSMNLYEFSQINNDEMGIFITRTEEPDLYKSIYEESVRLATKSEKADTTVGERKRRTSEGSSDRTQKQPAKTVQSGFCIRCNANIPIEPTQPYCGSCFGSWNRFKNRKFSENYCHSCGGRHSTSFAKPDCRSCYRPTSKA